MTENRKILIVDDNSSIHDDFKSILASRVEADDDLDELLNDVLDDWHKQPAKSSDFHFEIGFAFQGQEALAKVREAFAQQVPYALIFMDVRMPPGWDGIETIVKIWEEFADIEIVLCTAYSDYSWNDIISKLGTTDHLLFLKKPFNIVEVQQTALALTTKWNLSAKTKNHMDDLEHAVKERTTDLENTLAELTQTYDALKERQDQLIQKEKMASLGLLVAGMAHEVNTPIGVCVTAASYLHGRTRKLQEYFENDGLDEVNIGKFLPDAIETSDLILASLKKAANLISTFKQVSIDQETDTIRTFKLKNFIEGIFISLTPQLPQLQNRVTITGSDDLEMNTYAGPLFQVFNQLVRNSTIHAFDPGEPGVINIDIKQEGASIIISYADNGKGISANNLPKIFDPFFTTSRGRGNSGLGLHIVFNVITQKLNGDITCHSEVGQGATFTFMLPQENID